MAKNTQWWMFTTADCGFVPHQHRCGPALTRRAVDGGTHTGYVRAMGTIVVNGRSRTIESGCTVSELLRELGLDSTQVAVERNREIVVRADYPQTALQGGDTLEIVTFVGGG